MSSSGSFEGSKLFERDSELEDKFSGLFEIFGELFDSSGFLVPDDFELLDVCELFEVLSGLFEKFSGLFEFRNSGLFEFGRLDIDWSERFKSESLMELDVEFE